MSLYTLAVHNGSGQPSTVTVELPQSGLPDLNSYIQRLSSLSIVYDSTISISGASGPATTMVSTSGGTSGGLRVRMPDGSFQTFPTASGSLADALSRGGTALRPDGSAYTSQLFGAPGAQGWLLDGCPLNVVFGGVLTADQKAALTAAGIVTCAGAGTSGSGPTCQSGICGPSAATTAASLAAFGGTIPPGTPGTSTVSGVAPQVFFNWGTFLSGPFGLLLLILLLVLVTVSHGGKS